MVSSGLLATAVALAYQASSATAASFCDTKFTDSSVCLAEFTSTSSVTYRIAVPETAASNTPFETLLQIIAPATTGWAGIAWGGSMTGNPLTVGWPSTGNAAIVSSRWAISHTLPPAYTGASYTTLASSKNATHWTLSVVCAGCSQWSSGALKQSTNTLAWASSTRAVTEPLSNTSTFGYHTGRGTVAVDLSAARVPQAVFDKYVAFLAGGAAAAPAPPSSSAAPVSPSSSVTAPPPHSPSAAAPPAPPSSAPSVHPSTALPPAPPINTGTGSLTTIVSTVFVTVTPSSTTKIAPHPSSSITRTIIPSWASTPPKPAPTESGGGDDGGDDDDTEPTVTVTVIEGGTVPVGDPTPPISRPTGVVGKKKTSPFLPPFHRPPPFGIPGWA